MEPAQKKNKSDSVQDVENKLTRAIKKGRKNRVVKYLNELHTRGVHEGLAIELARRFLQTA